jgi:murein DD-endopeptidase MepM/ murein hydrolase activator NlpD
MVIMQVFKTAIISLFVLFLVGCQTNKEPERKEISPQPKKNSSVSFHEHTVKKGESLFTISRMYNASISDIYLDNNLNKNEEVMAGRILKVRTDMGATKNIMAPLLESSLINKDIIGKPNNDTPLTGRNRAKNFSGNVPYMLIPPGDGYQKSINGNTIKSFQTNNYGRPLEGVEIKSVGTQKVKAVHNGVVAFISENFAGYGRSIAVATSRNEIFFVYGLDSITVKIGEVVNKGSSIGTVNAGQVLGLKILRKGVFQDPGKLIPGL